MTEAWVCLFMVSGVGVIAKYHGWTAAIAVQGQTSTTSRDMARESHVVSCPVLEAAVGLRGNCKGIG
jgi:hypothetical protein